MKYVTLIAMVLLVGWMVMPGNAVLQEEDTPTYELGGLYFATTPDKMSGADQSMLKVALGDSIIVYARGASTIAKGGRWFELPEDVIVTWEGTTAAARRQLEITPDTAHVVTIKVIEQIPAMAMVRATATTPEGKEVRHTLTITH